MSKTIKVMFIVGTSNQTTMMHKIANELPDHYDCYFSNFYGDGIAKFMKEQNMLEVTIIGNAMCKANEIYFKEHGLQNDYRAEKNDYDLVFSTNDTYVPKNLQGKKMILVQEGILEPVDWRFHTAKLLGLPRLLADTSMMGLSDDYDYFCVFSEGYKKEFIKRGVKAEKIKVTSAPNFDDLDKHYQNDFPHRNYVLAITCNHRETRRADDRIGFIRKVKRIANGRPIIFKLHPREHFDRAIKEIQDHAPESMIYTSGDTNAMVANCEVVVATYSTVILSAAAMGKKVYSDFYSQELLEDLMPIQTGGTSARTIANLGVELIEKNVKKMSLV
jgi:hypothetical protein